MLVGLLVLVGVIYFLIVRGSGRQERSDATVVLREEQLQVGKTRERLADVTTRKEVTQAMKTVTVPVMKEELVVVKDGVEAARIALSEEQVDLSTRTVPINEVSVYRREWQDDKEIDVVLKREVARVETTGDVKHPE